MLKKVYAWFDNYWYHYKWQTLIVIFLVIVFSILAVQMLSKTDDDVTVMYAGPVVLTPNSSREVSNALQIILDRDFNNDGIKQVSILDLFLMSDEQLTAAQNDPSQADDYVFFNKSVLTENRTRFSTQIFAGECIICLLDPHWYNNVLEADGFIPLKDVLQNVPDYAYDSFSVYLKDTALAKYFTAFSVFPDDTLLCVRRPAVTSKLSNNKNQYYENQLEMFRAMIDFSIIENNTVYEAESE